MELQTISQVARQFNLSTRTLRYYEQIGLITSVKKEFSAYRSYTLDTIQRLKQIILLRKLRIPLKQIGEVLKSDSSVAAIEVFQRSLSEIEDEMTALSTIRSIIKALIDQLHLNTFRFAMLNDENLLEIVDSLTISKINFKEEKSMKELNQASEKLNQLTDKDVRIVYLPPATVAAYQYVGDEPELHAGQILDKFVRESGLSRIKPDLRHYGFNAPNPDETGFHGYEMWVTIPDAMELPEPLVKKQFKGGLYAAHMIPFGAFEEWGWLHEWVQNSSKYEGNGGNQGAECMFGLLEEHLNYISHVHLDNTEPEDMQLDLLYPIREIV